jgi:general L-amino acid transport system substrate-binding protein
VVKAPRTVSQEGLLHETRNLSFRGAGRARLLRRGRVRPDAKDGEGSRCTHLRRQPGTAGILQSRRQGQLDRLRCRLLSRDSRGIFNDPSKVKFTPLSAKDRFEPLKTGDIDVLSRNTTWTLSRDVAYGNFAGVTY